MLNSFCVEERRLAMLPSNSEACALAGAKLTTGSLEKKGHTAAVRFWEAESALKLKNRNAATEFMADSPKSCFRRQHLQPTPHGSTSSCSHDHCPGCIVHSPLDYTLPHYTTLHYTLHLTTLHYITLTTTKTTTPSAAATKAAIALR